MVAQSGNLAEGEKLAADGVGGDLSATATWRMRPWRPHTATASIEERQGHGVGQHAGAVHGEAGGGAGPGHAAGERPRDRLRYVGGGFGGKTAAPQAVEAARLAKITGKPVQVVWDRAEEFFFDTFRPGGGGEDPRGRDGGGQDRLLGLCRGGRGGSRARRTFYDIPNQRTASAGGWQGGNPPGMHPFDVGAWRAPSVNTNTFARESHMDMLAAKAGVDPLEFRLNHLTDARMRRVLRNRGEAVRLEARARRPADAAWAWPAACIPTPTSPYGRSCGG